MSILTLPYYGSVSLLRPLLCLAHLISFPGKVCFSFKFFIILITLLSLICTPINNSSQQWWHDIGSSIRDNKLEATVEAIPGGDTLETTVEVIHWKQQRRRRYIGSSSGGDTLGAAAIYWGQQQRRRYSGGQQQQRWYIGSSSGGDTVEVAAAAIIWKQQQQRQYIGTRSERQ